MHCFAHVNGFKAHIHPERSKTHCSSMNSFAKRLKFNVFVCLNEKMAKDNVKMQKRDFESEEESAWCGLRNS